MARIPRPYDSADPQLRPATSVAQLDERVASRIGSAGNAMGRAVEAIGSAFGEIASRRADVDDNINAARAKLDWYKADNETWRGLEQGAKEDGTGWEQAPALYDKARADIAAKYPINNPQRRADLDMFFERQIAERGFQAARTQQSYQARHYRGIEDQELAGAVARVEANPSQETVDTLRGPLSELVEGGRGKYHSEAAIEQRKRQIEGALLMGQYRGLMKVDPEAANELMTKIRGGKYEIDQTLGPRSEGPGSQLGEVAAKYESGGRGVGFISTGHKDPGGQSYGVHQLSTKDSMGAFLRSAEGQSYAEQFKGMNPGTPQFNAAYKQVAANDPAGFAAAQHAFYSRTHYQPVLEHARKAGFNVDDRGVQEALFSMSVQHGGARKIVDAATRAVGGDARQQIVALYQSRSRYVEGVSLPDETKGSVLNRYKREVNDALALAGQSGLRPQQSAALRSGGGSSAILTSLEDVPSADEITKSGAKVVDFDLSKKGAPEAVAAAKKAGAKITAYHEGGGGGASWGEGSRDLNSPQELAKLGSDAKALAAKGADYLHIDNADKLDAKGLARMAGAVKEATGGKIAVIAKNNLANWVQVIQDNPELKPPYAIVEHGMKDAGTVRAAQALQKMGVPVHFVEFGDAGTDKATGQKRSDPVSTAQEAEAFSKANPWANVVHMATQDRYDGRASAGARVFGGATVSSGSETVSSPGNLQETLTKAANDNPNAEVRSIVPKAALEAFAEQFPELTLPDTLTVGEAAKMVEQATGQSVIKRDDQFIPMGRLTGGQVFSVKSKVGDIKVSAESVNALDKAAVRKLQADAREAIRIRQREGDVLAEDMAKRELLTQEQSGQSHSEFSRQVLEEVWRKNPKKLAEFDRKLAISKSMHEAAADAVNVPSDVLEERLDRLRERVTSEYGDADPTAQAAVDRAEKRLKSVNALRQNDPARAVRESQEVKSVRDQLPGGQPKNQAHVFQLVDATLKAQLRLGIAQVPITKSEARTIMSDIIYAPEKDKRRVAEETAKRVAETYGGHAETVLAAAMKLTSGDTRDDDDMLGSALRRLRRSSTAVDKAVTGSSGAAPKGDRLTPAAKPNFFDRF